MNTAPDRVSQTLLCAGMLIIWYAITLLVRYLPNHAMLVSSGLLMPVLCTLEFAVLIPLFRWYRRHYGDIHVGKLFPRQVMVFSVLLILLLVSQAFYMQRESWTGGQFSGKATSSILFALAVVLLAPVYEEILFRGYLMQGFLLWAPRQRVACSVLTSLAFAAIHTQYAHLQTLIALVALSLLLCAARLVSGGLKLPIFLHMLNNLLGVAPWLWLTFSR
ncbi:CPBP family intramembrane glutamic endopeptidase [Pantoea coffeiphila]|uniref:CPBP family intramembrane metalloprotease n=1 Tax=Pantoea coffeiphila TaxID=1465635 RepID=A0A2S9IH67_9GAMM|nr:CPBP family intramembrane glutamic endopeptidase [Pantoea coffeiphila]PRD17132.1 CPBP family intramembrane metalloprotease [Pantoea coffeiphila]